MLKTTVLAALTATASHAAVLLTETFTYADGALLGQGTPAWTITGTSVVNPLTVSGNNVDLNTTGQDAYRALPAAMSFAGGASVFLSLDVNVSVAQATGDYFFHFSDPVPTTSNFYARLYIRSTTGGFQLGLMESSGTAVYGTTPLPLNTTTKLVITYNSITGASNDTLALYVNPSESVETSNTAYLTRTSATASEAAGIAAINLRQGSSANAPTLAIDNIVVATTFSEAAGLAAPIPEPSAAAALAGLVVLGTVATRRRRA